MATSLILCMKRQTGLVSLTAFMLLPQPPFCVVLPGSLGVRKLT